MLYCCYITTWSVSLASPYNKSIFTNESVPVTSPCWRLSLNLSTFNTRIFIKMEFHNSCVSFLHFKSFIILCFSFPKDDVRAYAVAVYSIRCYLYLRAVWANYCLTKLFCWNLLMQHNTMIQGGTGGLMHCFKRSLHERQTMFECHCWIKSLGDV